MSKLRISVRFANVLKAMGGDKIAREILHNTYFNYADVDGDPDKRNYVVSYEKLNKIGFDTTISLKDGIKELVKSFPLIKIKSNYHNVFQK